MSDIDAGRLLPAQKGEQHLHTLGLAQIVLEDGFQAGQWPVGQTDSVAGAKAVAGQTALAVEGVDAAAQGLDDVVAQ